ncbi:hypothetical protein COO60DRAFT_1202025 [Scenedesmus sp. NREL 46B-D3]|nr:hypothetical protein COO60DRAFT_1202025 [Scenedesmus sp. NREL 46B-D3]
MLSRQHFSSSMQNPKPSTRIAKAQSPAAIRCCIFLHLLPVTPTLVWCFPNAAAQHGIALSENKSAPKSSAGSCDAAPSAAPTVLVYASYVHQHLYRYQADTQCHTAVHSRPATTRHVVALLPTVVVLLFGACRAVAPCLLQLCTQRLSSRMRCWCCCCLVLQHSYRMQSSSMHVHVALCCTARCCKNTPHVEMHWQQQLQHLNTRVAYTASQMHW